MQDYRKLQDDVNFISEWVSANHLHLNVSRCKAMLISRKRTHLDAPPLLVNGLTLQQVDCFKYLDLFLTSDLSQSVCYIYVKAWFDLILSMPHNY